jgi:hypothetical protein
MFILGTAAYERRKLGVRYQCVELEPGQLVTGRKVLSGKCGLSEDQARTALKYLVATNRITIKPTNRFSLITVTNWHLYRDVQLQNPQHIPSTSPHIRIEELKKGQNPIFASRRMDYEDSSSKGYGDGDEYKDVSLRVYSHWESRFGPDAHVERRPPALKEITKLQRLFQVDEDVLTGAVDFYAESVNCGMERKVKAATFFRDKFPRIAVRADLVDEGVFE